MKLKILNFKTISLTTKPKHSQVEKLKTPMKHLLSKFKLIFSSLLLITSTPFTNICFTVAIGDGIILNARYLLGRWVLYRL